MKTSNQSPNGTSFQGIVIKTTANKLIEKLGLPNSYCDKSDFDWVCETDNGTVFTVYNINQGKPLDPNRLIKFHIGAHSCMKAMDGQEELHLLLQQ